MNNDKMKNVFDNCSVLFVLITCIISYNIFNSFSSSSNIQFITVYLYIESSTSSFGLFTKIRIEAGFQNFKAEKFKLKIFGALTLNRQEINNQDSKPRIDLTIHSYYLLCPNSSFVWLPSIDTCAWDQPPHYYHHKFPNLLIETILTIKLTMLVYNRKT